MAHVASANNQNVTILGTFHFEHFNRWIGYSIQDIVSVIQNTKPDVVLIETKKAIYEEYGVIDGLIDMILAYSYCKENHIETDYVDWWEVSDSSIANSTDQERDDHIYQNIEECPQRYAGKSILVICGHAHLAEQKKRFLGNGYRKVALNNAGQFFISKSKDDFQYPATMTGHMLDKIDYLQKRYRDEIARKVTDSETRDLLTANADKLVIRLQDCLDRYIIPNKLYD